MPHGIRSGLRSEVSCTMAGTLGASSWLTIFVTRSEREREINKPTQVHLRPEVCVLWVLYTHMSAWYIVYSTYFVLRSIIHAVQPIGQRFSNAELFTCSRFSTVIAVHASLRVIYWLQEPHCLKSRVSCGLMCCRCVCRICSRFLHVCLTRGVRDTAVVFRNRVCFCSER